MHVGHGTNPSALQLRNDTVSVYLGSTVSDNGNLKEEPLIRLSENHFGGTRPSHARQSSGQLHPDLCFEHGP